MTNPKPAGRLAFIVRLSAAAALALPLPALAHPGHGEGGMLAGALHAWHGLDHVLVALAVGIWAVRLGRRAALALPSTFVLAMAIGMAAAVAGWPLPGIEIGIAASMLALGILLAFDARWPVAAGACCVAAFAPFHAAAHVAEMALGSGAAAFSLGLLASTAMLHAVGIGLALALRSRAAALRLAASPLIAVGLWLLVRA